MTVAVTLNSSNHQYAYPWVQRGRYSTLIHVYFQLSVSIIPLFILCMYGSDHHRVRTRSDLLLTGQLFQKVNLRPMNCLTANRAHMEQRVDVMCTSETSD
jgi:hypothetical protein